MDKYDVLMIIVNIITIIVAIFILFEYALWSTSDLWLYCVALIVASSSLILYTLTKGKENE